MGIREIQYGSIMGENRIVRLTVGVGGVTEIRYEPCGDLKVFRVIVEHLGGDETSTRIDEARVNKVLYDD